MKLRELTILSLLALAPATAVADAVYDAVQAAAASPRNRALQRAAGDALKDAGRYKEAISFYLKADNAENLGAAEAAFYMYDFDRASEYLDKYLAKRTKAEIQKDTDFTYRPDGEATDWTEYLSSRIDMGRSMLDRVEKIQVIDSINVPADKFFNYLRLARSAGRIVGEETLSRLVDDTTLDRLGLTDISGTGYMTESGEDVIWTGADADGNTRMFESVRLADGTWDTPVPLFDYETIFGNDNGLWISAPFLMNDGVTLYFAADGEESLGGLDIFISRRDGDRFLQPSNIGMPYNSPFNDYLYAIDEQTGTGWWVTDRNGIPDMVTVYTFIPQELRINYPVDTPDLAAYAKVTSIAATQEPGSDHSRLLRRIESLDESRQTSDASGDFAFALPDGRIVRRLSDLRSSLARQAMQEYLGAVREIDTTSRQLAGLRDAYAKGDRSHDEEIIRLEDRLDTLRASLTELSNHVVTSEE